MKAEIYSAVRPTPAQERRFLAFLAQRYQGEVSLEWVKSDAYPGGFRLIAGSDVYDWSAAGRFRQLKEALMVLPETDGDVIPLIRSAVESWNPSARADEYGVISP